MVQPTGTVRDVDEERVGLVLMHLGRDIDARLRKQLSTAGLTPRHGQCNTCISRCDIGLGHESILDLALDA